jgi:hypothetical protein
MTSLSNKNLNDLEVYKYPAKNDPIFPNTKNTLYLGPKKYTATPHGTNPTRSNPASIRMNQKYATHRVYRC